MSAETGHKPGYAVVVIGGGHAGAEAAWAAANLLGEPGSVALVTLDPAKTGVMSCNPAIGGLAKGQLVREIDALGGLMGLAADATGIQFKVLNTSKGLAVHGPRCQSDKHAYAHTVRTMVDSRPEIDVIAGTVEGVETEPEATGDRRVTGVRVHTRGGDVLIEARAVVITTGTFMRGLMHTGSAKTPGGRYGEGAASGLSGALHALGFELGRLKTGTPPRLAKGTIDWDALPRALGDAEPTPFSELTRGGWRSGDVVCERFPVLEQIECRQTHTDPRAHTLIRENLDRAPMFNGQVASAGPRYCPSIEDKVVRFADRDQHPVYLEPESLSSDWVYCNGISSSLPADVQEVLVRTMPGCVRAEILRYGYAVEYDTVKPHQIHASGMTKPVAGLFLAGQINGTSGYEEAAAQGLVAGVNAARFVGGLPEWVVGRDEGYIGVLMDDLVTRTPSEPYRMFTSRAEHRLLLRADNAPDRLTPAADAMGLLGTTELGRARRAAFRARAEAMGRVRQAAASARLPAEGGTEAIAQAALRAGFTVDDLRAALPGVGAPADVWRTVHADLRYAPYVERQRNEVRRQVVLEHARLPGAFRAGALDLLRPEARQAIERFRPSTFGQAGRLEGVTPADLTLLRVIVERERTVAAGPTEPGDA